MGGLVKAVAGPVLGTIGGLISGGKAAQAANQQATAFRNAATYAREQSAFQPFGITTSFGSSQFGIDPNTGRVTSAGYTLDPRLAGLQSSLFGQAGAYDPTQIAAAAQPLYGGASSLFNLGQQYIAESPQAAAQRYVSQQQELLAPSRTNQLAGIRNRLFQTGRGGLGVQTGTGGAPASPELQAYYNALGQQDLQLAAQGQQAGMEQARFGAGLFGTGANLLSQVPALTAAGYSPLRSQLDLISGVERMGASPFEMSVNLGQAISNAGARQGEFMLSGERAAAPSSLAYSSYSPFASFAQGVGSAFGGGGNLGGWFDNFLNRSVPGSATALARGGSEGSLTWRD
jgi:hypothetical protein